MLGRLIKGLILGLVVGGAVAAGLVFGLHLSFATFGLAYLTAAATGVLIGLVAGKPIWSSDGKIEAGLKAGFGALLATGAMFAARQWLHAELDVLPTPLLTGSVSDLPMLMLPAIGAVLGAFYEVDNDAPPSGASAGEAKKGAGAPAQKKRVQADADAHDQEDELDEEPAAKKKRK